VALFYSLCCGQFYVWPHFMSLFLLEGISEIFLLPPPPKRTPANSEARFKTPATSHSYFTLQSTSARAESLYCWHCSPISQGPHVNHLFCKDWYEKRLGGWLIFQTGSLENTGCHPSFSHISHLFICLICPGKRDAVCYTCQTWQKTWASYLPE